uniref:Uncharacterized protein n=1 Tax=Anguilla anguilla TaxID=7936 RepID=A0A0E9X4G8_ANGAN
MTKKSFKTNLLNYGYKAVRIIQCKCESAKRPPPQTNKVFHKVIKVLYCAFRCWSPNTEVHKSDQQGKYGQCSAFGSQLHHFRESQWMVALSHFMPQLEVVLLFLTGW